MASIQGENFVDARKQYLYLPTFIVCSKIDALDPDDPNNMNIIRGIWTTSCFDCFKTKLLYIVWFKIAHEKQFLEEIGRNSAHTGIVHVKIDAYVSRRRHVVDCLLASLHYSNK